jgi:anti-anti-sigma factor
MDWRATAPGADHDPPRGGTEGSDTVDRNAFSVGVELLDDTTLVWVRGELDMLTQDELGDILTAQLQAGASRIVLDLQRVGFVSCSALRVLTDRAGRARELGISVSILPSRAVTRIATILEVTELLDLVPHDLSDG